MDIFKTGNGTSHWLAIVFASVLLFSVLSIAPSANAQLLPIPIISPPTGLTVNLITPSEIKISWTAPSNPTSLLVNGYKIERSTDGGNTWAILVANTGNTSTTYTDTGLAYGTTYTYRVSTISTIITSSPSNTASATTTRASISGAFLTCCYGAFKIVGGISNPVQGDDQFQLQVHAPNGQLVVNKTYTILNGSQSWGFVYSFGISRDQGKGNYTLTVVHHDEVVGKTQVPSWINNTWIYFVTHEGTDGGVSISGRAYNGISGEQITYTVLDPSNSTTATYVGQVGLQGQLSLGIYATQNACISNTGDPTMCQEPSASEAFPVSGNYTIIANISDVTAKTTLSYTR